MKILYVINQLDSGGAEQQLVTLCEQLTKLGNQLYVISIYNRLELQPRLEVIRVPVIVAHKYAKLDVTVVWRLRRLIMQIKPDLIHAYLPASSLFAGITRWLGVNVPVVQGERSVNSWRSRRRIWLDNIVRQRVAAITCNADAIKRHLVKAEGVPPEKISLIYNGLAPKRRTLPDTEEVQFSRKQIAAPQGSFVVICVANFVSEKAHAVLLAAFAEARRQLKDLFLVLVGKGELENDIRRSIYHLGVADATRIIGNCTNPLPFLRASHVALLTSFVEGCSNALLEAMAMGLPVIASDTGGNRELVSDGRGGTLCPVGDVNAFSRAILNLAYDVRLAHAMGLYNRRRIEQQFTDDIMVEQTIALYHRLLNGTKSKNRTAAARLELD